LSNEVGFPDTKLLGVKDKWFSYCSKVPNYQAYLGQEHIVRHNHATNIMPKIIKIICIPNSPNQVTN
jgi:hypothetical protein